MSCSGHSGFSKLHQANALMVPLNTGRLPSNILYPLNQRSANCDQRTTGGPGGLPLGW